jgi:ubiquinone biosynthesis protein COQ4
MRSPAGAASACSSASAARRTARASSWSGASCCALSDRERLLALPPETLGHRYAEFMGRERISAQGLAEASLAAGGPDPALSPERRLFGARLRDMHDLWHVVTGYGRDLVGEAALLAFTYADAQPRHGAIVAMAWWKAARRPDAPLPARRLRRGKRAAWLPAQTGRCCWRALDEVRAELGVGAPPRYQEMRSRARRPSRPRLPAERAGFRRHEHGAVESSPSMFASARQA